MKKSGFLAAVFVFLFLAGVCSTQAGTKTWTAATGTNDWFVAANWGGNPYPTNGDNVVITNAGTFVLLTNSTEYLGSIVISNTATLVFSNWNTRLSATNVTIATGAVITCVGGFVNGVMSNRVYIITSNLLVAAGGNINVNAGGWARGGDTGTGLGNGTGAAGVIQYGSSYGGLAGLGVGISAPNVYGTAMAPADPGSGGYTANSGLRGGHGGGAVQIQAPGGQVVVNGLISANGGDGSDLTWGTGGTGGGIYIACDRFEGVGGVVQANAGAKGKNGSGGGRIAIVYNSISQSSVAIPSVSFSVLPGAGGSSMGDIGTIYFTDSRFITAIPSMSGQLVIPDWTNWSVDSLNVSNVWLRIPSESFVLTVTNNIYIQKGAKLELGGNRYWYNWSLFTATNGPVVNCGGNLILTNGGGFYVYGGGTNIASNYTAVVNVSGDILIADTSCWIYAQSNPTNGGAVCFRARNFTISTNNAGVNASSRGYGAGIPGVHGGYGPGGNLNNDGSWELGASYGGLAGGGTLSGSATYEVGSTYGSASAPSDPGSGGQSANSSYLGGYGGGAVMIQASNMVVINGTISANGGNGGDPTWGGGGSGGGIFITCYTFTGTNGIIQADAGTCGRCCAGGGRIALIYNSAAQSAVPVANVRFSVRGGTNGAYAGDIGTIYFPDDRFAPAIPTCNGQIIIPGWTNWAIDQLVLSNTWIRFPGDPFTLTVSNDLCILGPIARFDLGGNVQKIGHFWYRFNNTKGPVLTCGRNLILTNGGSLYVHSGPTNSAAPDYGALVSVAGNIVLGTNCWINPVSHPTNGGSPLFRVKSLSIATNAGFNADANGYAQGYGPGCGIANKAGSYGGLGGGASSGTYGSSNAPVDPGSGGYWGDGHWDMPGGNGGGLVRIMSSGTILLDGIITAKGGGSSDPVYGPNSGSGGGIYIYCRRFSTTVGATASLSANGGPGGTGGGGGGRIAVWRISDVSMTPVTATVAGGPGGTGKPAGSPGTIVWGWLPPPGTVFVIH